jgi:hypothetical protein
MAGIGTRLGGIWPAGRANSAPVCTVQVGWTKWFFQYSNNFQIVKYEMGTSGLLKISKLVMMADNFKWNNFPF